MTVQHSIAPRAKRHRDMEYLVTAADWQRQVTVREWALKRGATIVCYNVFNVGSVDISGRFLGV